ncbi:MAG: Protease 4 [Bacteroidia bacterium]|nr:Protease 4 [Bacteroidia bacterium]
MKQFFKFMFASMLGVFLAFFLGIIVLFGMIAALISSADSKKEVKVEPNSVLHINFEAQINDRSSNNPFENFDFGSMSGKQGIGLNDILENIEKAKTDENIKGIYIDLQTVPAGIATIEEIRNKLIEFKESKKFIVAYSEVYTQGAYYLASVADEVWLNPEGLIEFKGLGAQVMFFKGLLEKLEVEPQVIRYGKFKSAIEPFILDKMSEANREQTMKYMGSIWDHIVKGIAESRKLTPEQLNLIADSALVQNAKDAVEQKLADKLYYKDQVLDDLKDRCGLEEIKKLKMVSMVKYKDAPKPKKKEDKGLAKDKIAVIYASGSIEGGEGDDQTIGSDRISKAIRKARLDENVKAIVLRVNSPGGSSLASDVIWREVVLAKAVKPVVASMGDVAASGGYYISCAADTIIASPNTITGSIGVFGLLMNLKSLMNNKLGVTIDTVKTNHYADLGSAFRPLTQAERDIIQNSVNEIYDSFITKVAEGRGMKKADVDSIGQGRVWSGVDAKELGLVDVLGGMEDAIEIAAKMAKLDHYRVAEYPEQKDPFKAFMEELQGQGEDVMVKNALGENYRFYKTLDDMRKMEGIQARMPFDIYID